MYTVPKTSRKLPPRANSEQTQFAAESRKLPVSNSTSHARARIGVRRKLIAFARYGNVPKAVAGSEI